MFSAKWMILGSLLSPLVASSSFSRNLQTIKNIYDLTVFPNNVPIIESDGKTLPPGLFSPFATGRVDPLGNFSGFTESVEYFFALAPVPMDPTFQAITKAEVVEFTSGCSEIAASSVHLTVSVVNPNATNNGQLIGTIKQTAFWRFDDNGAVLFYDAVIPNLELVSALLNEVTSLSLPAVQAGLIDKVCQAAQQLCFGNNTQYSSFAECNSTLTSKTFGTFDEVWGDNVVCRQIHAVLAVANPVEHCPHVGPTGGGKCIDVTYETVYIEDDVPLFNGPLGTVFVCPTDLAELAGGSTSTLSPGINGTLSTNNSTISPTPSQTASLAFLGRANTVSGGAKVVLTSSFAIIALKFIL